MKEILGDAPDIVFEHVGKATFPTSVFTVKPFGKVVICAGTTGFNLDFDVRYLWMKQKEILGSHFANAYECMKANELIESGQIRPVLWRTLGFDGVAEAHQLMLENKHLGKISILVGARDRGRRQDRRGSRRDPRGGGRLVAGTVIVPWYATGFRADAFELELEPVAAAALRYGASAYAVYRARDDRYKFQQFATFEHHLQWDRYWAGPEMTHFRTVHIELVPGARALRLVGQDRRRGDPHRCRRAGRQRPRSRQRRAARRRRGRVRLTLLQRRHRKTGALELLPVVLGRLLHAGVDDRLARVVDHAGDLVTAGDRDAGDEARQRARDVLERVVIVVAYDHPPRAAKATPWPTDARKLDRLCHAQEDKGRAAAVQLST